MGELGIVGPLWKITKKNGIPTDHSFSSGYLKVINKAAMGKQDNAMAEGPEGRRPTQDLGEPTS